MTTPDHGLPKLHIRPERGWLNDPNGIGFWDGRWQVFFQYNPDEPFHTHIGWGHSTSADLLRWRDEPVAMTPRPGTIDAAGVWSGVATIRDGGPVLVYTAIEDHAADAGVAIAERRNGRWAQPDRLVASRPDDRRITEVRDPFLFTFDGREYAIQGTGYDDGTPVVLVYDVSDFDNWTLLGPLVDGGDLVAGELAPAGMWECPQLIELPDGEGGQVWVLIVSLWDADIGPNFAAGVRALIGAVEPGPHGPIFVPSGGNWLDMGPHFYAPQVVAADGRALMWSWSPEPATRSREELVAAGWAGVLTFPRELAVRDGRVVSSPAAELTGLRSQELGSDGVIEHSAWEAAGSGDVVVGLVDADGEVDRVWTGSGDVRVLVDGSIVETFVDGQAATVRVYREAGQRWHVSVTGGVVLWALELP